MAGCTRLEASPRSGGIPTLTPIITSVTGSQEVETRTISKVEPQPTPEPTVLRPPSLTPPPTTPEGRAEWIAREYLHDSGVPGTSLDAARVQRQLLADGWQVEFDNLNVLCQQDSGVAFLRCSGPADPIRGLTVCVAPEPWRGLTILASRESLSQIPAEQNLSGKALHFARIEQVARQYVLDQGVPADVLSQARFSAQSVKNGWKASLHNVEFPCQRPGFHACTNPPAPIKAIAVCVVTNSWRTVHTAADTCPSDQAAPCDATLPGAESNASAP